MTDIPKADMRAVKVLPLDTGWIYKRRVGDLCERCGDIFKCNSSSDRASKEFGADMVVSECGISKPILVFREPVGIDDEFNTMRLGKAWFSRLYTGKIISMWDKTEWIGDAMVIGLEMGDKEQMMAEHSYLNHALIEQMQNPKDAADMMPKILRSAYGNLIYKHNDLITVIYLKAV